MTQQDHDRDVLAGPTAEQVARMEGRVFAELDRGPARPHPRRRVWLTVATGVALVAVTAVASPLIVGVLGGGGGAGGAATTGLVESAPAPAAPGAVPGEADAGAASREGSLGSAGDAVAADREVVATAAMEMRVESVAGAAAAIRRITEGAGGYVEQLSVGGYPGSGGVAMPEPSPGGDAARGWIQVRVPAGDLTAVMTQVDAEGDVLTSSVSTSDVTTAAVDLRARISAAQASVDRLTTLMGQSATVADLLAAESALAERQATLESLRQQLTVLEDQVAMSTLTVIVTEVPTATADAGGFWEGLRSGWSGLLTTLNALLVAAGFALPWLIPAAVITMVVWLVVRALRRRARRAGAVPDR